MRVNRNEKNNVEISSASAGWCKYVKKITNKATGGFPTQYHDCLK